MASLEVMSQWATEALDSWPNDDVTEARLAAALEGIHDPALSTSGSGSPMLKVPSKGLGVVTEDPTPLAHEEGSGGQEYAPLESYPEGMSLPGGGEEVVVGTEVPMPKAPRKLQMQPCSSFGKGKGGVESIVAVEPHTKRQFNILR